MTIATITDAPQTNPSAQSRVAHAGGHADHAGGHADHAAKFSPAMFSPADTHSRLDEAARREIRDRAAEAAGSKSVVDAVLCALIEADIDQWDVSLDDWKGLLFEAFQVARESREGGLAA